MFRIASSPPRLLFVAAMCLAATQAWASPAGGRRAPEVVSAAMAAPLARSLARPASSAPVPAAVKRPAAMTAPPVRPLARSTTSPASAVKPLPTRCTPAAITDLRLRAPAAVDEIRAVLSNGSPAAGATDIRVSAGRFDRVLHVRGDGARALTFTPALTGAELRVSLDPVFDADRGACIRRVELLHDGAKVAVVPF